MTGIPQYLNVVHLRALQRTETIAAPGKRITSLLSRPKKSVVNGG
jgi:hypothetical protein